MFGSRTVNRGISYAKQGNVQTISYETKGVTLIISATVNGSRSRPYQVHILLDPATLTLQNTCSCPMDSYCKHVVATLIIAQDRFKQPAANPALPLLDTSLTRWLEQTQSQLAPPTPPASPQPAEPLTFVLSLTKSHPQNYLKIAIGRVKKLKNGSWSALKKFSLDRYSFQHNTTLSEQHRILIETLKIYSNDDDYYYGNQLTCHGSLAYKALNLLLDQHDVCCFWDTTKSQELTRGENKPLKTRWDIEQDGTQSIQLHTDTNHDIILPTQPLLYINTHTSTLGLLETPYPQELAIQLQKLPPISPLHVETFCQSLQKIIPSQHTLPEPQKFKNIEKVTAAPQLFLKLITRNVDYITQSHRHLISKIKRNALLAKCMVRYDQHEIDPVITPPSFTLQKNNTLYHYTRDMEAEISGYDKLEQLPLTLLDEEPSIDDDIQYTEESHLCFFIGFMDDFDCLNHFQTQLVPQINQAGWEVVFHETLPSFDCVEPEAWYTELDESSDYDWFNMQLGVIVDGQQIDLLPLLIDSINRSQLTTNEKETILKLPQNKSIKIPTERMQHIVNIITHLIDPTRKQNPQESTKVELRKLALLKEIDKAFKKTELRRFGNQQLLKLAEQLSNFKKIKKAKLSNLFNATLRPYQHTGVSWLQFLREYRLNGVLADDMGLGKTIQILAHLAIEKTQHRLTKPTLIIAPTSVVTNWKHEIERFTPSLTTLVLQGADRECKFESIPQHDIILTSYALVTRDQKHLTHYEFYYVILDEAHYIKNKTAKKTQIIQQLNAQHRLCLTGTPLENHLGELWSQFHFLMPGLLGNARQFKSQFQTPIEKQQDHKQQQLLIRLTKPFLLRRNKQMVIDDLPEKTTILKYVTLEQEQRDLYESIRLAMDRKVRKAIDEKGIERSQIIILDALLKLRQACCDPRLLSLEAAKHVNQSAKLDLLMSLLTEMLEEKRRILLFSQFTGMLSLIESRITELGIDYVKLTGNTRDREKPIHAFQHKGVPLFLISLKAGGVGLNLTAADTVIHYDPWWNPAVEQQATDRAHRIGQKRAVFVYKLITTNTIEEKIVEMQSHKQALANALFDKNSNSGKLNKADLQKLFLPA